MQLSSVIHPLWVWVGFLHNPLHFPFLLFFQKQVPYNNVIASLFLFGSHKTTSLKYRAYVFHVAFYIVFFLTIKKVNKWKDWDELMFVLKVVSYSKLSSRWLLPLKARQCNWTICWWHQGTALCVAIAAQLPVSRSSSQLDSWLSIINCTRLCKGSPQDNLCCLFALSTSSCNLWSLLFGYRLCFSLQVVFQLLKALGQHVYCSLLGHWILSSQKFFF